MSIAQQAGNLALWEFWLLFVLGLSVAFGALYFGFRYLYLLRLIENLPTSAIGHAQQGYVELNGSAQALDGSPLRGPLSGNACCWYRYAVEKKGSKGWRRVDRGESTAHFVIRDQTGDCVVDPAGAKIYPANQAIWHGRLRHPKDLHTAQTPRSILGTVGEILTTEIGSSTKYRYSEARIVEGETVFVTGYLRTLDEIDLVALRQQSQRAILSGWKSNQARLLAQFDSNRDGTIDSREWELARQAAHTKSVFRQRQWLKSAIPHSLSAQGPGLLPFLISTKPESELVRIYRLKTLGALSLFLVAGSWSLWLLSILPGG
ncbi:MAG: hypothetical protein KDI63_04130 [Gammaproteobacteria bacterium]|nr:hypothetical protein [Gammaproteobacteria bacterium]